MRKLQEKKHPSTQDFNETYDSIYQNNSIHEKKEPDELVDYQVRRKAIKDVLNGNS